MTKASSIEKHKNMVSRHKDEFKLRRERLNKDPFIDSYEKELAKFFRKCAKKEISFSDYEKKSAEIEKKRQERLIALGEDAEAMTYKPLCDICDDSGYVNGRTCKCLEQLMIDDMYAESGIADILKQENFSTFDPDVFSDASPAENIPSPKENAVATKKTMMNYVKNFDKTDSSLFFVGPTGTGKSFMAHCVAKALLDKNKTVVFTTAFNMCKRLVDHQFGRLNFDEVSNYFNCDFLIIDELGQETNNEPSRAQLYNIINERMNRKKKTLITSNYPIKRMEELYEERLISRLSLYRQFHFFGDDLRVAKNVTDSNLNKAVKKQK